MSKINYTKIVGFLTCILLFTSIFDPSNKLLYSKYPVFIVIFAFTTYGILTNKISTFTSHYIVILSFIFIGVSGYTISLFFDYGFHDNNIAITLGIPFFFSTILLTINADPVRFRHNLFLLLIILCILILILGAILLIDKRGQANPIIDYLNFTSESAKITFREFGFIKLPMIYYKTSALLLIGIAILFNDKKCPSWKFNLLSILFMLAFILSGTRANIIICLVIFILLYLQGKSLVTKVFSCFSILIFVTILSPTLLNTFFSSTEISNTIKLGHLSSYITLFFSNIKYVFIGDGFGSLFYTKGLEEGVYNTEIVYLDLIRWFGMLPFLMILLLLLYPALTFAYKRDLANFLCYLGYLIITATNPLLMSSTGMLAISFFYYEALSNEKNSCDIKIQIHAP